MRPFRRVYSSSAPDSSLPLFPCCRQVPPRFSPAPVPPMRETPCPRAARFTSPPPHNRFQHGRYAHATWAGFTPDMGDLEQAPSPMFKTATLLAEKDTAGNAFSPAPPAGQTAPGSARMNRMQSAMRQSRLWKKQDAPGTDASINQRKEEAKSLRPPRGCPRR